MQFTKKKRNANYYKSYEKNAQPYLKSEKCIFFFKKKKDNKLKRTAVCSIGMGMGKWVCVQLVGNKVI